MWSLLSFYNIFFKKRLYKEIISKHKNTASQFYHDLHKS